MGTDQDDHPHPWCGLRGVTMQTMVVGARPRHVEVEVSALVEGSSRF